MKTARTENEKGWHLHFEIQTEQEQWKKWADGRVNLLTGEIRITMSQVSNADIQKNIRYFAEKNCRT